MIAGNFICAKTKFEIRTAKERNNLETGFISNNQLNGNLAPLLSLTILKHPENDILLTMINIDQERIIRMNVHAYIWFLQTTCCMKMFFTCLTSLFIFQMTQAQDITIPLWPAGKIPNYQKSDEVEKSESADIVRITKVQSPEIAVFLPTKRNASGQAVIICPGGGYAMLAYDWEGTDIAKLLNSKGIIAIVLKYRLPSAKSSITPNITPLTDAKRAMRIVRANAGKWGIKKNDIGIMGFSAGGHLASTLATHFDDGDKSSKDSVAQQSSRPDFAVLIYPVITMNKLFTHMGSRNNLLGNNPDSSLVNLYSNELQVTKQTPPTFLLHATDDGAVPVANSLRFYEACKTNGVPVEMHIFPKGGHGFGLALGKGSLETWPDLLVAWMRSLNK